MKQITLLIFTLLYFTAYSQSDLIQVDKKFTIKLSEAWAKSNNHCDTIKVDNKKFGLLLDTSGLEKDIVIKSVTLLAANVSSEISSNIETSEFKVGVDSSYTFVFQLAKIVSFKRDSIKVMVRVSYKTPGSVDIKDSIIEKEKLLDVMTSLSKQFLVTGQIDTTIKKQIEDTAFHNEKTVKIIFENTEIVKTEMERKMDQINSRLEDLFKEQGTRRSIGYFNLLKTKVLLYEMKPTGKYNFWGKEKKKPEVINGYSIAIKKVEIVVGNGCIIKKGVMVELEDGKVFRNNVAPISLYRFNTRTGDRLYFQDKRKEYFIELGDVFSYNYSGKFHYPDEDTATLSPARISDSIYNFSAVNDLIDVTVYTDLLGLVGRKPNAVLQTQLSGNFITNTRNWVNRDFIPLNFIKPYFRLSKFDSRFAQIDTNNLMNDTLKNRLYLNQISYLQAGVKLNIFRIGWGPNQQLLLNAGADVNLTSADSLLNKDITSVNYYPEIEYRVIGMENFGMEISCKWIRQIVSKNATFNNVNGIWIFNPQATIYYNPFDNPNNRIYIRYSNFAEIGNGKYNFSQFQFGFKTNLFNNGRN